MFFASAEVAVGSITSTNSENSTGIWNLGCEISFRTFSGVGLNILRSLSRSQLHLLRCIHSHYNGELYTQENGRWATRSQASPSGTGRRSAAWPVFLLPKTPFSDLYFQPSAESLHGLTGEFRPTPIPLDNFPTSN